MDENGPLRLHQETVRPEWLDYNGHMNLAYYVLAFDHATDRLLDHLGLGAAYKQSGRGSIFVLETHVVYRRELLAGDPMRFSTWLLGHDAKRLHFLHHMHHAGQGYLAATTELMALHVALDTRRGAPMPADAMAKLKALQAAHDRLPRPEEAGRSIAMKKPG
ncbi:MAG: thioesterase family protein [Rhodospirillales bacterium]